jgi:uncharacterized protein (DUF2235 family)
MSHARRFDHVGITVADLDTNLVGRRSVTSARSRRPATSIACATSAKRRRSRGTLRHHITRHRLWHVPAAATTGLDGYRK